MHPCTEMEKGHLMRKHVWWQGIKWTVEEKTFFSTKLAQARVHLFSISASNPCSRCRSYRLIRRSILNPIPPTPLISSMGRTQPASTQHSSSLPQNSIHTPSVCSSIPATIPQNVAHVSTSCGPGTRPPKWAGLSKRTQGFRRRWRMLAKRHGRRT